MDLVCVYVIVGLVSSGVLELVLLAHECLLVYWQTLVVNMVITAIDLVQVPIPW